MFVKLLTLEVSRKDLKFNLTIQYSYIRQNVEKRYRGGCRISAKGVHMKVWGFTLLILSHVFLTIP